MALTSQVVFSIIDSEQYGHQNYHLVHSFDDYSIIIGQSQVVDNVQVVAAINVVKITNEGIIEMDSIIYEEANTRFDIYTTGYFSISRNDTIYAIFNKEGEIYTELNYLHLFVLNKHGHLLYNAELVQNSEDHLVRAINSTIDNNLILIGGQSYPGYEAKLFLTKIDVLGNVLWEKEINYSTSNWTTGYCVAQMPNGDYIISGDTYIGTDPNGDFQMYYARTDSLGNVLWEHEMGAAGVWDNPAWFELRTDGGINLFGGYNAEPFFAKVNPDGEIYLEQYYSFEGRSVIRPPIRLADKYIFLVANITGNLVSNYVWTMDTNFNKISSTQLEFMDFTSNQVQDVKLSADCGLVMCGYRYSGQGNKGLIVKTNLAGESCGEPDCYDEYINEYGDCVSTSIETGMVAVESGVMISPNPMSDQFIITLKDQEISPKAIKIFTADGRQVMEMDYREEVLVSSLSAGLYLVEIVGEGFSYFAKVVVSKYE